MSDESWPISEEILSAARPVGLLSEGHKNLGFVLSRIQSRFVVHSRVFKIQRRDRNESVKKNNRFSKQNNNFARASHFLYISLPFLHDYDVKMPNFAF